jgi:hypothetical protein
VVHPSSHKGDSLANRKYSIDFQAHNQAFNDFHGGVQFYKLDRPPPSEREQMKE